MNAHDANAPPARASILVCLALAVAIAAVAGSLALSLVEHKVACALCFYQRTFAMSIVAVLLLGLLSRAGRVPLLALLALPLALAGAGVAGFHVYLETNGTLECPAGLYGILTAPKQSLAAFAVLSLLLLLEVVRGVKLGAVGVLNVVVALALGGGLVWGSISANPAPLPTPKQKYDDPVPKTCRPPFHEPAP
jgi:disulfide bond formation protein DsbB